MFNKLSNLVLTWRVLGERTVYAIVSVYSGVKIYPMPLDKYV